MWWTSRSPAFHDLTEVAELARPPCVIATTWSTCSAGVDDSRAMPTAQPPAGGGPATATSPPRLTSAPPPISSAMRAAARSAANAFAVEPRSSRTPRGIRTVRSRGFSCTCMYPATGPSAAGGVAGRVPDLVEVGVVAERGDRVADRRVDGATGAIGRVQGDLEGLEEQAR